MLATVSEYLNPEFMYFAAIKRQSILIYPFEYIKHLEPLLELLREWYMVEPVDGTALNNAENIEVFLAQSCDLLPEEKPWMFVVENMTADLMKLFEKYPQSPFLGLTKDTDLNPTDGNVVLYNKKLQTLDPLHSGVVSKDQEKNLLLEWCHDIVDVANQKSLLDAKSQMQEIREITQELFELIADFSVSGYAALMAPLSPQEQQVVIHLCASWFQVNVRKIIPQDSVLNEVAATQQAFLEDISKADDINVYPDPPAVPEIRNSEEHNGENTHQTSSPYLMEIMGIGGNKDIDLAFAQTLRRVPLPAGEDSLVMHEEKYVKLRETIWSQAIPKEFFIELLLIHMREVVKVKRTAISEFKSVIRDEFIQLTNIFGHLCPVEFWDFDQVPLKIFFEDTYIANELITDPTHIPVMPFDTPKSKTDLGTNVSNFSNFLVPDKKEDVNEHPIIEHDEPSFRILLDAELQKYVKKFSLLDPDLLVKLHAETHRLSISLNTFLSD